MLDALKESHIRQPSEQPYNFSVPVAEVSTSGQYGQPWYLDKVIFKKQVKNGFFIGIWFIVRGEIFSNNSLTQSVSIVLFLEAGAVDFEMDSNSLHFELEHGWTGLLVEPNPIMYPAG